MILVGDIGATKTRVGYYSIKNDFLNIHQTETYVSKDFANLEEVIGVFIKKYHMPVDSACFGVPGPVIDGYVKTTNLPWEIGEDQIARLLSVAKVKLVNDLEATAAAIPYLSAQKIMVLHKGQKASAQELYVILAPGTGLGVGLLYRNASFQTTFASEGGHSDFAPNNDLEIQLLKYLQKKYNHVSCERVLTGSGLVNIYQFLKESGLHEEPPELAKKLEIGDPAAFISAAAQDKSFEICVKALDIFTSILGSLAGNFALTLLPRAIYLGGGIPPKICKKLGDGSILKSYLNKGRMSEIVAQTPLIVIRDDYAALLGAASIASNL
ncbi:MAG TPA: glucokinase [Candidatus Kapabacteria bacterium]|nr:glucokinase [Candidatus Kapabacteria bacterium]